MMVLMIVPLAMTTMRIRTITALMLIITITHYLQVLTISFLTACHPMYLKRIYYPSLMEKQ